MSSKFILLFQGRVGGSYCQQALASHPRIHCEGEILSAISDPVGQIERARRAFAADPRWAGFKTKLRDIADPTAFAEFVERTGVRALFLHRRNTVKAAISVINGKRLYQQHGVWNLTNDSQRLPPFSVSKTTLDQRLARREQWDSALDEYYQRLDTPKQRFHYEELIADEAGYLDQLLDFLGADKLRLKPGLLKNTNNDLRQVIANFDELRAAYAGTRYQAMFDDR